MKTIKLKVPSDASLNHSEISTVRYELNTTNNFSGTVVLDVTVPEKSYYKKYNFVNGEVLYARITANLISGGGVISNTFAIEEDTKLNTLLEVYPPNLTFKISKSNSRFKNILTCTITEPKFFIGQANHVSTSWSVKSQGGSIIKNRPYDKDNKLSLDIDLHRFKGEGFIFIEVDYNFDLPTNSLPAKGVYVIDGYINDFGIDNYIIDGLNASQVINIVNNQYEFDNKEWKIFSPSGELLQSGNTTNSLNLEITVNGVDLYDYDIVTLEVTMDLIGHGVVTGKFELTVSKVPASFPITLPIPTN